MKTSLFLSTLIVGLCLVIIYQLRKRPGEVIIAPMSIEFEEFEDLQDLSEFGPDIAMGKGM